MPLESIGQGLIAAPIWGPHFAAFCAVLRGLGHQQDTRRANPHRITKKQVLFDINKNYGIITMLIEPGSWPGLADTLRAVAHTRGRAKLGSMAPGQDGQ